jgi:hypothetical protein
MEHGILYAVITVTAKLVLAGSAYGIIRWLKKKADLTETRLDNIILVAVGTPPGGRDHRAVGLYRPDQFRYYSPVHGRD